MDEPYLGEIRPISFNYAPKGWALCAGQLLPINQNQALFSLLGVQFGGNGVTNFALPNLMGRVPVGTGQLANGSNYTQGITGGVEQVQLLPSQVPAHQHTVTGTMQTSSGQDETSPANNLLGPGVLNQYSNGPANAQMAATTGQTNLAGGQPHENRAPYVAMNYVIALTGIYPSRQ